MKLWDVSGYSEKRNIQEAYLPKTSISGQIVSEILGTLRSDDGDGNGNVTRAIGLLTKTTTLHVHLAFFVHFFAVTARLRRENA